MILKNIKMAAATCFAVMMLFSGCNGASNADGQATAQIAESYVGRDVSELVEAIGEPESSSYQTSCELPDAQDGFLDYDGFTVVTLKDKSGEIVQRIEEIE